MEEQNKELMTTSEDVIDSTEKEQETKKVKKVWTLQEYHSAWNEMNPTRLPGFKGSVYLYGTKNLTKMIMFLREVTLKKEDLDYWMDFENNPISRKEDEDYEEYKVRRRFQGSLIKYKREIRSFIVAKMIEEAMRQVQESKEDKVRENIINDIKETTNLD